MNPALPLLAERHSVVIWDWRSLGLSTAPHVEYTLESTLRDMEAVADAAGECAPFDLMASMSPCHSAIAFAARYPERVRRMVLWNPSPAGMSPRTSTLADLPDIVTTHFPQYVQLAALHIFGWDRADMAKRWERDMTAQFTADDWLSLMDQMEQVDGSFVIPTVPSTIEQLTEKASDFLQSLADAPVGELVVELRKTVQSVDALLNSPSLKGGLDELKPLLASIRAASDSAKVTLEGAGSMVGDDSALRADLLRMLDELTEMARSVRTLTVGSSTEGKRSTPSRK